MIRPIKTVLKKYGICPALLLAAALVVSGCGRSGTGTTDTSVVNFGKYYQHGGMVAAPDGSKLYVTNYVHNTILVLAPITMSEIREIPVNCLPRRLAINPAGTKMFVGHDQTTCNLSPLGNNYANNTQVVSVVDLVSNSVTNELNLTEPDRGLSGPRGMAWDATRDYVVGAFYDTNAIGVFTTATGSYYGKVTNVTSAVNVAITSDGATYLAPRSSSGDNSIAVINGATRANYAGSPWVSATSFSQPAYLTLSADDKVAFIANYGNAKVVVVDITNPAAGWNETRNLGTINVGTKPSAIALTSDGSWLLVACANGLLYSIPWGSLSAGVGTVYGYTFNIGSSPTDIAIIGDNAYVSDLATSNIYRIAYKSVSSSAGLLTFDATPFAGEFPRP